MALEHKHLIVRGVMVAPLTEAEVLDLLNHLVNVVDMELMKLPNNPNVGFQPGENCGVTGVAIITTSHMVLHTWDDTNDFQFDLYSCKMYDPKSVLEALKGVGLHAENAKFFDRKYKLEEIVI